jgi:Holliday junction resolvase RusA-like endonuclease
MPAMIEFEVPGTPVGKGRPRFSSQGGFVKTYTPEKTASYESLVRMMAAQAMNGRVPVDFAVSVTVDAYFEVPASWSKKKREAAMAGQIFPFGKDIDNIAKAVLDGMNSIVYVDDRQVVTALLTKRYSDRPRVHVGVIEAKPCNA